MSAKTHIAWTSTVHPDGAVTPGATWNCLTGCNRDGPDCEGCYAEFEAGTRMKNVASYAGTTRMTSDGPRWTGKVNLLHEKLDLPIRWQRPRMIFVNSMSDVFHKNVPFDFIDHMYAVMAVCPRHRFQILTKRGDRMVEYYESDPAERIRDIADKLESSRAPALERWTEYGQDFVDLKAWPLPNVWAGISAGDQETANRRVPYLLLIPAAVHWVSYEPSIGRLDLTKLDAGSAGHKDLYWINALTGRQDDMGRPCRDLPGKVDWVVAGGESGSKARPSEYDWYRSMRDDCSKAGVPFFMKQVGAQLAQAGGMKHRAGADPEEWPDDLRVRQFPEALAA